MLEPCVRAFLCLPSNPLGPFWELIWWLPVNSRNGKEPEYTLSSSAIGHIFFIFFLALYLDVALRVSRFNLIFNLIATNSFTFATNNFTFATNSFTGTFWDKVRTENRGLEGNTTTILVVEIF